MRSDAKSSLAIVPHPSAAEGYELTVVIPTYKEAANIAPLVARLDKTLAGVRWEAIFVDDDSPDGTADQVRRVAQDDPRVRVLQRIGRRGLSSACIEGALAASGEFIAIMDADLQHDEAVLPSMLDAVKGGEADLAVGTRYADGGSVAGWNAQRARMSRFATWITRTITGVTLSDPLSGFFLMRRDAFQSVVRDLSGLGFKILLDILASSKGRIRVTERAYTFRNRAAGESKLDAHVLWDFLLLLLDKRFGKLVPARFVSFAFIGGIGVIVHFAVLTAVFQGLGWSFATSQASAAGTAMIFNYALNNALTYRDQRLKGSRWFRGLAAFMAICSIGAAANVGVANYLFVQETNWMLSAVAGILIGAVWNYAVSSVYTWRK